MSLTRCIAAVVAGVSLALASACGSDNNNTTAPPKVVDPVIGLTATPLSSTSIKVTFPSRAGDNAFSIERAEGASGTFTAATSN